MRTALALASSTLWVGVAHALTLPPPPASPAPVTNYEYDAKGNLTKVIKGKGVAGFGLTTQNAYDALDRVKTSTDAKNGVTGLNYDGQDNVTQVTDPRSLVTQYQLNGLGDLTQLSSPDTGTANSTYDAAGKLLTRTDSRGVLATYTYDVVSRPTSVTYTKAGEPTVSYGWTYDQSGGVFGYGVTRLTTATFPAGSTQYGYDAHGRVTISIQTVGGVALATRYTYDLGNHVTSIMYPSGRIVSFTYEGGQLKAISLAKDATSPAQPLISQIQWRAFGPAQSWQMHMASGTRSYERVFDQYGRLVRYPLNNVVRDVTYDAANRITSYTHLDATTGQATAATQALEQNFGYDELGRLTTISTASQSWTISYDANGNRTNVTLNGTSRDYTVSTTSNRLNQISNPARSLSYDAAGNTLADTAMYSSATYATDNRLTAITKAGTTTAYSYDAGGQRVRKLSDTTPSATRLFVYGQDGQTLGEYSANGAVAQEIVWMGDLPIAVLNGSDAEAEVMFAYADHLGASRILVDKTGAERWRWISEPFGSIAADPSPAGFAPVEFNLRFPGQYLDKESGLAYNYFRDYDGSIGRYVQSDPSGLGAGVDTYSYVGSSATMLVDPLGLLQWNYDHGVRVDNVPTSPSYNVYPGQAYPTQGNSRAAGVTTMNWSISAKCSCIGDGYKFDEAVVRFGTTAHISDRQPRANHPKIIKAEGDHAGDFRDWGERNVKARAEDVERRLKVGNRKFSSNDECERFASAAIEGAFGLANPRKAVVDSVNRWDYPGGPHGH